MKGQLFRRVTAMVLTLCMLLGMIPVGYASDTTVTTGGTLDKTQVDSGLSVLVEDDGNSTSSMEQSDVSESEITDASLSDSVDGVESIPEVITTEEAPVLFSTESDSESYPVLEITDPTVTYNDFLTFLNKIGVEVTYIDSISIHAGDGNSQTITTTSSYTFQNGTYYISVSYKYGYFESIINKPITVKIVSDDKITLSFGSAQQTTVTLESEEETVTLQEGSNRITAGQEYQIKLNRIKEAGYIYQATYEGSPIALSLDQSNPDYYVGSITPGTSGTLNVTLTKVDSPNTVSVVTNEEAYGSATFGACTDQSLIVAPNETITITASPEEDCVFYGWKVTSGGNSTLIPYNAETQNNTMQITVTTDVTYTALFEKPGVDEFVFRAGTNEANVFLGSQGEEAMSCVAGLSDKTVYVVNSGTISESFVIPSGVTLLLPYDDNDLAISTEDASLHANVNALVNNTTIVKAGEQVKYCLTIPKNVTVTCASKANGDNFGGRIVIGGNVSYCDAGKVFSGQTCGAHSEIALEGKILMQTGAVLSCCGYITGGGRITATGASVYEPFVVNDMYGGSYMAVCYMINKTMPLNCYTLPNIQCDMEISNLGRLIGYVNLHVNNTNQRTYIQILADDAAILESNENTVVKCYYEPTNKTGVFGDRDYMGRNVFYIYNGGGLGSMTIPLDSFTITIDSKEMGLPFSYNTEVHLCDGDYTVNHKAKLNPGSELYVEEGATLTVNGSGFVYSGTEFLCYESKTDNLHGAPSNQVLHAYGYPQRARLIVNGKLIIAENATFAGLIESKNTGAVIEVRESATLKASYREGVFKGQQYNGLGALTAATTMTRTDLDATLLDAVTGQIIKLVPGTTYKSYADATSTLAGYEYYKYDWDNGNTNQTPALTKVTYENPETISGAWSTQQTLYLYYNGGLMTNGTITAYIGESLAGKVPTENDGVSVIEWQDDSGKVYDLSTMPAGVTKLNAVLGINKTLTFHENDGTESSQSVDKTYDRELSTLPELFDGWGKTGYVFSGWNTNADGTGTGYSANASVNVSNLTDLYAQWTAITYTVSFDGNGADGGSMANATWTYDKAVTPANGFTKTGYTFDGWKDAAGNTYEVGASIGNLTTTNGDSVTLTAQWTPITYRVEFANGGGTGNKYYQTLTYDQETSLNTNTFSKTGYSFAGWKVNDTTLADGALVKNLANTQDAVVTLTAQWTINQYTMTFDTDGGNTIGPIEQNYGTAVTAPVPVKEGYTFAGWDPEVPTTMPAENTGYKATWTVNSYTITFNTDGGSTVAAITQDYGTAVTAPENPTRIGYTFAGWNPALPATMPVNGMTVTAQWTANSYDVLYYAETGATTPYATVASTFDAAYTLPTAPEKTGYTFAGWVDAYGEAMPPKLTSVNTESYYATYAPVDVTIQLDANGGTLAEGTLTAKYDSNYFSRLPTPTRTGYIFDGWYYGNVKITEENAVVSFTETCTLTAGWTAKQYGISYAMDGGTFNDESAVRRTYDIESSAYTIPEPVKEGYTFNGWTGSNGTTPEKTVTIAAGTTGNLSYTANWTINEYTIKFVDTDGSVIHSSKQQYGSTVVTPATPTKTGYTFTGWEGEIPATMPAEDVTITATWTVKQYTITFDSNGGTSIDPITQDYGTKVTAPADPTKTGYKFTGWAPTLPETMPADSKTHTAQWTINQYTITFVDTGDVAYEAITQDYNTAIAPIADPVKSGYTFLGWDAEIPATMPANNVTITAKWAENATVTLVWGYDSKTTTEKTYVGAAYSVAAEVPARVGYTFDGWFTDGDVQVSVEKPLEITEDITLYAQWTEINNTITYNLNGGTLPNTAPTGYSGATDVTLVAPTRTGYTFIGWTGSNGTEPQKDVTIPKGSSGAKEYTANWAVNKYTITFDTDGGNEIDEITEDYGTAITAPANPEKTGYTFAGWNREIPATMPAEDITIKAIWTINSYKITFDSEGGSTVGQKTFEYGADVTVDEIPTRTGYTFLGWDTLPETMPANDVKVKATWKANSYELSFHLNYQTTETVESITQTYDKAYILAADPTRTGYTFGGWYTTVDCQEGTKVTISDLYQVDGAQTLYAKWTVVSYSITFDSDGGSAVDAITADYGTAIEKPADPTKTGYTFAGWDAEIPGTMPAENMTIKATWTVNQYTITFDTDGGSVVSPITQDYGTAVKAPAAPIKTGYTFAGWDTEIPGTMPAGDMTIKATWTVNQYTITFDTDGGSSVESITADFGAEIEKPANPAKTGYTFKGWDVEFPATMPAGNRTLKAVWEINQYTITFDTDGGSEIAAIKQDYGTAVTAPENPTKPGYAFKNWDKVIPSIMPAEDMTITASWDKESYVLTLNVDGEETKTSVLYEAPLTALADKPGKTGHIFRGWYSQPDGGKLYTTASTMPAGPLTLYAQWDKATYTITYMYGETVVDKQTWEFEEAVTVSGAKPSREGYTFLKWAGVPGTMPAMNLTVYPEWDPNEYTIRFENTGNTIVNSITADYESEIQAPADPVKTGYKFIGWEPAIPKTMPLGGLTVTAQWEPVVYTITFNSNKGSEVPAENYYYLDEISKPAVPTREGYSFVCWHKNADLSDGDFFAGTVKMPAESFTLYAEWIPETCQITLDPGEGGTVSQTVIYGLYDTDQDVTGYVPRRAGYQFKGWYYGDTLYDTTFKMPAGGITLTAKYDSYLDLLYNLAVSDIQNNEETLLLAREYYSKLNEAQDVAYDQSEDYQTHREAFFAAIKVYSEKNLEQSIMDALEPTNKILENHGIAGISGPIARLDLQGHHLEGVLLEEDCLAMSLLGVNFLEKLFEFEEIVEIQIEDTVVTNIAQLDIMLAVAYATLAEEGQTMDEFMNYLMNDEVQYSMTVGDMDGTAADAIVTGESVEGVRYSLDYSFLFFNETHTVRWNDGATVTDQLFDYQSEIPFNDAVTKTGYTLSAWKDASGNEVTFPVSMGKTDVEYFAVWTPNEYQVELNYCDGRENETVAVTYGGYYYDYLPKTASREGYTFKGWYSKPDGQGIYYDATVKVDTTETITAYAFWGANEFSISFNSNGGTPVTTIYQPCDTAVAAPAEPTREGYEFAGWYIGEEKYTFTTMPAEHITLTAKWTPKTYTITFLDDDGEVLHTITAKYGEAITAPADPSRTGYTFKGWDKGIPATMPVDGLTITAQWEKNRHTITYDTKGGTPVTAVTLSYGTEIPIPEEPTKVGYTFLGWEPEIPATMPDEDMTITAIWQVNSYKITFDSDGGSSVDTMNVNYGAAVTAPADPSRTGYTFMGWDPQLPATMPAYDLAVTATWEANEYLVTLDYADGVTANSAITVRYNGTYEALPVPTRDGYDFVGWFDGETQININTVVTILAAQTLTARWNESGDTPYQVEHYQQGLDGKYTLVETTDHTGVTGGTAQASHQSYTGFHANSEFSDTTGIITADGKLVLKVYYDRNTYNITWKVKGTVITESWAYGATPVFEDTAWEDDIHYSYTFTGWDQQVQTVSGDATYTAQYDKTHEASIGTVTYKTLKLALEHSVSGNVVRVDANITLTEDLAVPAGVTLLIPCKDDDAGYNIRDNGRMPFNHDGTNKAGNTGIGPYAKLYKSLTVPEGITLTVKGTVLINSVSGRPATTYYDNDITGGYAQINLDGDMVVEAGGQLDCFGFIKGDGMVTAKNGGGVGDLYVVRNWRGGTQGLDMYQQDVYPINEYDCHNIETDLRLEYGANLVGMVKMFANAGDGGKYYYTRFPQVDNTNGLIRLTTEDSYVIRKYVDGVEKFYIYGGANFGSSALTLLGMSLSTAMMTYPTDGDITYDLYDGEYHFIFTENNGNWDNGFKLLTGSSLTIHNGASLTVDPGVTLSVYKTFVDGTKDATKYPDRPAAYIQVEKGGKFINAGSFGGIIKTESPDILIGDYPNWGTVTYETAAFTGDTDELQKLIHDLEIYREGYSWKYGEDLSIIWIGADYTAVESALKMVPDSLFGYSKETRSAVEDAVAAVVYDLPKTRQGDVDAMAKAISDAVKNLKLAVITVHFDSCGGSSVNTTLTRTYGDAYGTLPETSMDGYEFVGWYTAVTGGQLITQTTNVGFDEDITLYAKWRDATITEPADYSALDAAVAAVPTDVAGYTDASVAAMRDAVNKVEYGLTIDRQDDVDAWTAAIYAAIRGLTPKTLTVTFNPGEGRASFLSKSVTYLSAFGELPTATRQFYSFVGWFTGEEGGTQVTADTIMKFTEDTTLFARYVQVDGDYTLVNRYLGLIEEAGDLTIYSDDSVAKINAAVSAVVMGLGAEDQDQIDQMAQALRKAWNGKTLRKVFVTFKPNGGQCTMVMKQYRYGDPYSDLPVATRDGYTFLGWFTDAQSGTLVDGSVIMNQVVNHNLYAQWKWNGADYSKVDAALARVPADLTPYTTETKRALQDAINAIEYELGAAEQSKVDGWAEAINKAVNGLVKKTLTVTFNPNGGKVAPATKTVSYGGTVVMPVPTYSGYKFDGWYNAKTGGTRYADSTVITANVTLYARWIMISADYTEVNKAIAEIPSDLSIYTSNSVAALIAAKNAVKQGLSAAEQSTVNGWAAALRDAISSLVRKLPFVDVKESDWFYSYVSELYYASIVNGTGDGTTYSPTMVTDRAQMAVLLYRISGSPASSGTHPFTDVPKTAYYYDAVCWAYENGVVNGTGDGSTYSPYMGITREMFATMLYRLYGAPKAGGSLSSFPDGKSVSSWAMDGMTWAVQSGIITGKGDGTLAPQAQATRAEVATMLQRYVKLAK